MDRWSGEQRGFVVKAYYQIGQSLVQARHAFRRHFNIPHNQPVLSDNAIRTWICNLEETGSMTKKRGGSVKTVRTENIAAVREAMVRCPRRSAKQHSLRIGISDTSVRRILHKDLHLHPYKLQIS
ncbi:hypothetical protein C0J52_22297 [Blattella germanica]|nr:hypothetical protein C0J52_22297 [Blattella germanica]